MSLRTAGIIFAIIDIVGVFNPYSRIANIAHLVGLGCGLGFGYYLLKQKKRFTKRFVEKPTHRKRASPSKSMEMSKEEIEDYLRHGRL